MSKPRALSAFGLFVVVFSATGARAAVLSAANVNMQPGATASVLVSGDIAGESTFGVSVLVELVNRAGHTGTVTFTPAVLPTDVDITQLGDPWPGEGTFSPLDTDTSASLLLNGAIDDNGTFLPDAVTFSGPLAVFPIVASADAGGVWDVVLATSVDDSSWEGLVTMLIAGTITVVAPGCTINEDCDDGVFCNGEETCATGACVAGTAPCAPTSCDEAARVCVDCATGECPPVPAVGSVGLGVLVFAVMLGGGIVLSRRCLAT